MSWRRLPAVVLLGLLGPGVGCGLPHDGLGATSIGVGDDGGDGIDGSVGSGGDGGGAPDGCVPTGKEDCTDGVDNDCNGAIDCADEACSGGGYRCVPDPSKAPSDWELVALDATGRPGCPSPLASHDVDVDPTDLGAPAGCECACAMTSPPSCDEGNINVKYGLFGCNNGFSAPASSGQCNTPSGGLPMSPYVEASTTATGGACMSSVKTTLPPTGATQGQYCDGQKKLGAGCSGGEVCALVPPGASACLLHPGAVACPGSGYTKQNDVGTLADDRQCGSCNCGAPTARCAGTWSFYDSKDCTGQPQGQVMADGTCQQTGGSETTLFPSNRYVASAEGATCGAPQTGPAPTGAATLMNEDTICCE